MPTPITERIQTTIPAAAITVEQDQTAAQSHVNGTVASVTFVPEADIVADVTDYRTYRLINRGQDGTGDTLIASLATTATDLDAFVEQALTLGTPTVAQGDILVWEEAVSGDGVASPGGRVEIEIARS